MKKYKPYDLKQPFLIAPDLNDWLEKDHLARFIAEVVENLDLSPIYAEYDRGDTRGQRPYDPKMMLGLIFYANCAGIRSSRKVEKSTYEHLAFRFLSADQHPDHDTICEFINRHEDAIEGLFLQILKLCDKAGLVKLEQLDLDGTRIRASANKSRSRKYEDLKNKEADLEIKVKDMMGEWKGNDAIENQRYGKDKRGDEMPEGLRGRKDRLRKIKALLAEIERESKDRVEARDADRRRKKDQDRQWEKETGQKISSKIPPKFKDAQAAIPTSRRSLTDYDARIQRDGITGGTILGYNCQAGVDSNSQVIVSTSVINNPVDALKLTAMLESTIENTGKSPKFMAADTGYFDERSIVEVESKGVDLYIPPRSNYHPKQGRKIRTSSGFLNIPDYMREKLKSKVGSEIYSRRRHTVEPVFGVMKEEMGLRRFFRRGLKKVGFDWQLICLSFNLRKLHTANMMEMTRT